MPMTGGVEYSTTRFTDVCHGSLPPSKAGTDQEPIACVSSYYDPTNATTAQNGNYGTDNGLPWGPVAICLQILI